MSSKSDMYDKYGDIIPDGYNSPIELIAGNLQTRIENDAVKVVQSYGFNVDKAELEKALKYDRDQYEKGYADARKNYEKPHGKWIPNCNSEYINYGRHCSLCGRNVEFSENFCPKCGADMRSPNEE